MDDQKSGNEMEEKPSDVEEKKGSSNALTIILAVLLIGALAIVALLLIVYVFGGDSSSGSEEVAPPIATVPPAVEEPVELPLQGTDWILAGTIEGTTISLVFTGDSLSGFAGCNNYNASYRSTRAGGSSNDISVGDIASGLAACEEPIMTQEQSYLANLASANSYAISGNTLTLTTGGGALTFGAAMATQSQ